MLYSGVEQISSIIFFWASVNPPLESRVWIISRVTRDWKQNRRVRAGDFGGRKIGERKRDETVIYQLSFCQILYSRLLRLRHLFHLPFPNYLSHLALRTLWLLKASIPKLNRIFSFPTFCNMYWYKLKFYGNCALLLLPPSRRIFYFLTGPCCNKQAPILIFLPSHEVHLQEMLQPLKPSVRTKRSTWELQKWDTLRIWAR